MTVRGLRCCEHAMTPIASDHDVVTLINIFAVALDHQQELVDLLVAATEAPMCHQPSYLSANVHRSLESLTLPRCLARAFASDVEPSSSGFVIFLCSALGKGSTVIRNPSAAATSASVPRVGLTCPAENDLRTTAGSTPMARAREAFDMCVASRASSSVACWK